MRKNRNPALAEKVPPSPHPPLLFCESQNRQSGANKSNTVSTFHLHVNKKVYTRKNDRG